MTDGTAADYRVSFEAGTVKPDVRIALVDRAETADFVLVDDVHAPAGHACKGATQLRTVAIAPAGRSSDLSIGLVAQDAAADYKLYVHSARFSPQDAAALFAVISKGRTRRDLAGR